MLRKADAHSDHVLPPSSTDSFSSRNKRGNVMDDFVRALARWKARADRDEAFRLTKSKTCKGCGADDRVRTIDLDSSDYHRP